MLALGEAEAGDHHRLVVAERRRRRDIALGDRAEADPRHRLPRRIERRRDRLADPANQRFGGGGEFGRHRMRCITVAAEEAVEQLEQVLAVEDELRARPSGAHRQRLPGGEVIAALGLVVGEALDRERLRPATQLAARKPFEQPLHRLGEPRREVLDRDEIAERVEVRRPQRRRVVRADPGALAPIGRYRF